MRRNLKMGKRVWFLSQVKQVKIMNTQILSSFISLHCHIHEGKPLNITIIQVYAESVMLKKLKLNGSRKTYKTF